MDLKTISLDPKIAREKFLEYRREVRSERGTAEDAEIMRGYRWLAQGKQLLSVTDALRSSGLDDAGRPKLAIARADKHWCYYKRIADGTVAFAYSSDVAWSRHVPNSGTYPSYLEFRAVFDRDIALHGWEHNFKRRAVVPVIPPTLRPGSELRNFHILWEPNWEEAPPSPDPLLLKRVSHDLYAVLAVWDLTEVELSVLGRRFSEN